MNQIIASPLSDKRKKIKGVTQDKVSSQFSSKIFPSIYIDSDKDLSVLNGSVTVEGTSLLLSGKTIVEVVKFLNDNGITAYITDHTVAAYPASLLQDFWSADVLKIPVDTSPLRITEFYSQHTSNLVEFDNVNIDREIIGVWRNGNEEPYELVGELLYTNAMEDTECLLMYRVKKYFLFCSDQTVIDSSTVIKDHYESNEITPDIADLLSVINSDNKDVL